MERARPACAPPSTSPASTRTRSAAASCSPRRARCRDGVVDVRLVAVAGLPHAVRHNMNVTFHCFADEANAHVRLLQPGDLRPGDSGWAQIKLETPVAAVRGDRFVLRTPNDTVAGGVIADVAPKRHRRGDAAMIAALGCCFPGSPSDAVLAAVGRRHPLIDRAALTSELAFSGDNVDAALAELVNTARSCCWAMAPARAVLSAELDRLKSEATAVLGAFHREHPAAPRYAAGGAAVAARSQCGGVPARRRRAARRDRERRDGIAGDVPSRPTRAQQDRSLRTWQRSAPRPAVRTRPASRHSGRISSRPAPSSMQEAASCSNRLVRRDDREYPDAHRAARRRSRSRKRATSSARAASTRRR